MSYIIVQKQTENRKISFLHSTNISPVLATNFYGFNLHNFYCWQNEVSAATGGEELHDSSITRQQGKCGNLWGMSS